jgi:hypothetical protein
VNTQLKSFVFQMMWKSTATNQAAKRAGWVYTELLGARKLAVKTTLVPEKMTLP